jgi:hypothetical protein
LNMKKIQVSKQKEAKIQKIMKKKSNNEKVTCTKIILESNSRNALCWTFYCVNDNKEIDLKTPEIICCIICYNSPILD